MSIRHALVLVLVAGAAALVPATAQTQTAVLVGTVGTEDAFEIDLTDSAGTVVTHLDPGTYTIVVHDRSALHDFHLSGPGVNMATGVSFTGDATWTVTFQNGSYDFFCDPHRAEMQGSFTVGTPPPPPAAPKRLSASVGPGAKISLVGDSGGRVKRLAAGRYLVSVRDRTSTDNFRLRGPGLNRATGVRFVGRVRWTVTLRPGRYTFRSDRNASLRGALTVTA